MATRKKVTKKKPKKVFELVWTFENYEEHPTFYTKRMFGGMASYVHHRMVSLLAENPGDRTYRGVDYGFDVWNGVLYPTDYDQHESLQSDFPSLIQHPVLKKWLYLPLESDDFEDTVHECSLRIRRNDKRFGIYPQNSAPKKKKTKKKKVSKKKATKKKT